VDGKPQQTDQESADIGDVPNWATEHAKEAGHSRKRADDRFLAIREPLRQPPLGDQAQLPFPTQEFGPKGTYKLFGVVTNRKDAGGDVVWWLRERCGKSQAVHSVMQTGLAGGQLPSASFGANAAWWALMILAHNLNTAMKRLVLGKDWLTKRMKTLRWRLIGLPGRVVNHARKMIIRPGAGAEPLRLIVSARQTIRALAGGPSG
jgi:hypothetical protein